MAWTSFPNYLSTFELWSLTSHKSEVKDDEDNEGWVEDRQSDEKSANWLFQHFPEQTICPDIICLLHLLPVEEVRCHLRGGEDDDRDQVARESKKSQ